MLPPGPTLDAQHAPAAQGIEVEMGRGRVWLVCNGARHPEAMADGLPTADLYFALDLCRGDTVKIVPGQPL